MSRSAFCLFCDDIRQEANNKASFMGTYGDELLVPTIPVTVARFCVAAWATTEMDNPFREMAIRIECGENLLRSPLDAGELRERSEALAVSSAQLRTGFPDEPPPRLTIGIHFVISPFEIKNEGPIRVWFETESEELRAGIIWIRAREVQPDNEMST